MGLLPVKDALARITGGVKPLKAERVDLADAAGRVLARDITATRNQPPFAASAMDGYAVRAADVANTPVHLKVIGEAPAGRAFTRQVRQDEAVRIFTGAPLPKGADAIVIQENTFPIGDNQVEVREPAGKGLFVRPPGMDFAKGDVLIKSGTRLNARTIGVTAAANRGTVHVRKKPVVALLANGDELVPPGGRPRKDQIISSNAVALAAAVNAFGGTPIDLGIAPDNTKAITAAINKAKAADILVTIGGASVGDHDLVGDAFAALGVNLDFWKIAMRPGKPLMFARRGHQRILGLPGNPVSALVCARVFLKPLISAMLAAPAEDETITARLSNPLPENDQRQEYMRAVLTQTPNGLPEVTTFPKQDSAMQLTLAKSNALVIRPPFAAKADAGEVVEVLPINY